MEAITLDFIAFLNDFGSSIWTWELEGNMAPSANEGARASKHTCNENFMVSCVCILSSTTSLTCRVVGSHHVFLWLESRLKRVALDFANLPTLFCRLLFFGGSWTHITTRVVFLRTTPSPRQRILGTPCCLLYGAQILYGDRAKLRRRTHNTKPPPSILP